VGSSLGLAVLERGRFRALGASTGLTDDNVRVLMRDRDGAVWVGTDGGGLFRWDGTRFDRQLPGASVHALHRDSAGRLWVATSRGLIRRAGARADVFTEADGLSSHVILSFAEDPAGGLWIGTGNGLSRWVDGRFRAYTGKRGLFDERVNYVFLDGAGDLWMTSGVGVFRARRADFDRLDAGAIPAIPFVRYGIADGLPSTECAGYRQPAGWGAPDGRLFIPTLRGVAVLDPRRADRPAVPMPIRIDHLSADGQPLPLAAGTRLRPGVKSVELRWAGLSFRAPTRNHFRYRLDPYDADWLEAGARTAATYGELPPGRYRFRVIGASSDGLWNQTGDSFAFAVAPRFHQTVWFEGLLAAALVSLAVGLHRLRTRSLRARFAAVLAERGRIARELHDTFDQGLAAAGMQIQVAAQTLGRAPEQARASLDRARRALEQTLEEGRRSVWALRSLALEQGGLPEAFVRLCRDLGAGTRAAIRVDVEGTPRRLRPADEAHVLRIGQEAITNALRHGSPRSIVVRLGFAPDRFSLRVRDDGGGFDPRAPAVGLGLRGMHERAAEMGATITVDSRPGEETEIALEVPAAAPV
jgi:signal transduction histidine kinase